MDGSSPRPQSQLGAKGGGIEAGLRAAVLKALDGGLEAAQGYDGPEGNFDKLRGNLADALQVLRKVASDPEQGVEVILNWSENEDDTQPEGELVDRVQGLVDVVGSATCLFRDLSSGGKSAFAATVPETVERFSNLSSELMLMAPGVTMRWFSYEDVAADLMDVVVDLAAGIGPSVCTGLARPQETETGSEMESSVGDVSVELDVEPVEEPMVVIGRNWLEAKADLDSEAALRLAAEEGSLETVVALVSALDVPVDGASSDGRTALWEASRMGHAHVVKWLIVDGGSTAVGKTTTYGVSPACAAAHGGFLDVLKTIVEHGGEAGVTSMSRPTADGLTPLFSAARSGHVETVAWLVGHGAPGYVDIATDNGNTPLHTAAAAGNMKVVKALVSAGANVNAKTSSGRTAIDLARTYGFQEVIAYLSSHGGKGKSFLRRLVS